MRAGALLMALMLVLAPGATAAKQRVELSDIEDEVMCPICGTALGLSEAPQAERERAFIRKLIARGKTKEEIKEALVAEYGSEVLAVPEGKGFDLAAWLVPGVGIALAGLGLAIGLRRWRKTGAGESRPPALSPAEAERLDADLAKYDL